MAYLKKDANLQQTVAFLQRDGKFPISVVLMQSIANLQQIASSLNKSDGL